MTELKVRVVNIVTGYSDKGKAFYAVEFEPLPVQKEDLQKIVDNFDEHHTVTVTIKEKGE